MKKDLKKKVIGRPLKAPNGRTRRNISLSDEAWSGLESVATLLGCSKSDLLDWWATLISKESNKEVWAQILDNEKAQSYQELYDRFWAEFPRVMQQISSTKESQIEAKDVIISPPSDT